MAPEKVPTTAHSGSRTIWVKTSAASPRLRPPKRGLAHGPQELVKIPDAIHIQRLQGSQAILGPVMKILMLAPHFGIVLFDDDVLVGGS